MSATRAYVVAAGGANYGSLREACRRIGIEVELGDDPARIRDATHVILPGVGAAAHAMHALRERGLDRVLAKLSQPFLGICLGMQLLFEASEEIESAPIGRATPTERLDRTQSPTTECLGLLHGCVRRLQPAPSWPHMGWNTLAPRVAHPLLAGIGANTWFYFVHGYAAPVNADCVAATEHGEEFASMVARDHVYGAQFHPEKSSASGRCMLQNFFALT